MDDELISLTRPFTEAETREFLSKLWHLLAKQTERYTMGDSTSIPIETAQELLESICYTLQFEMIQSGLTPHELLKSNLYDILKNGQVHLATKVAEAKQLWEFACAHEKGDTASLRWIGYFFRRYDLYFFAHQTPWDMGYPVNPEASEALRGITWVEGYLREIIKC